MKIIVQESVFNANLQPFSFLLNTNKYSVTVGSFMVFCHDGQWVPEYTFVSTMYLTDTGLAIIILNMLCC